MLVPFIGFSYDAGGLICGYFWDLSLNVLAQRFDMIFVEGF
jgi:hypothetical protein